MEVTHEPEGLTTMVASQRFLLAPTKQRARRELRECRADGELTFLESACWSLHAGLCIYTEHAACLTDSRGSWWLRSQNPARRGWMGTLHAVVRRQEPRKSGNQSSSPHCLGIIRGPGRTAGPWRDREKATRAANVRASPSPASQNPCLVSRDSAGTTAIAEDVDSALRETTRWWRGKWLTAMAARLAHPTFDVAARRRKPSCGTWFPALALPRHAQGDLHRSLPDGWQGACMFASGWEPMPANIQEGRR